jgi:hypothetical protein
LSSTGEYCTRVVGRAASREYGTQRVAGVVRRCRASGVGVGVS